MGMQGGMMGMGVMPLGGQLLVAPPIWYDTGGTLMVWQEVVSPSLEGVYLKDKGVVYTATLSSLQSPAKAETARPVSEWERARREVRKEKESPKKTETSKPPELSDVLLKALAENGRHFSQLGENESVTLVITVRGQDQSSTTPKSQGGKAKRESNAPNEGTDDYLAAKVRDLELLGDLHMKQEHYGMARDTYRKALDMKPGRQQMAVLARKLAQAYLMLSSLEEARSALDQSLTLMKENGNTRDDPAAGKPAEVALPVKLIISAPKKLLDQVGEGKISFDEFRRQASVEKLTFGDGPSRK